MPRSHENYGQSRMTWKPIRACDPWDFLQFRDDALAKGSQEPVRLPYGYCMGPYGACASTVWTHTCLRTPLEFYDHCTWPVMAVSAYTSSWPRTTAYVPSTGKKRCACTTFRHGMLTGIRGLSIRAEKNRRTPCGPVRYAA